MGAQGTATINFGAIGSVGNRSSVNVTGQASILSNSAVEGWLRLEATAEHPVDDLLIDPVKVIAGNIVAGTGFTLYAEMPYGNAYGNYKVDWAWN